MEAKKILVVEDSESEFFFLKELFARHRDRVFFLDWQPSYEKALSMMVRNTHDAYIIDYRLGDRSGIELIAEAKSKGCSSSILLLTGFGGKDVDLRAQSLGVDDYIIKDEVTYRYLEKSLRYAIDRRRSAQQVMEQQLRLSHALKMSALGELSSGIAHEVNNPLAIVSGLVSQVQRRVGDVPEIVSSLQKIDHATRRITKIVRGLSSFSRNAEFDPFEQRQIKEIVDEAISLCMGKIRFNGVRIDLVVKDHDLAIDCRPGEILQLVVNLINSVVDSISDGGDPWIRIELSGENQSHCEIVLTSSEFDPSSLGRPRLRLPDFSPQTHDGESGFGLGTCKMIAESHAGKFSVVETSQGHQFVVELPVTQNKISVEKVKVLVVDDEKELRNLVAQSFEIEGCEVFRAKNGKQALETFIREEISVIVSDINMPEMTGLEMAEEIYKTGKEAKIVFMTGYESVRLQDKIKSRFKARIFSKPFRMVDLMEECLGDTLESKTAS